MPSITEHHNDSHIYRLNLIQDDIRVSTSIHRAGQYTIGFLNNIDIIDSNLPMIAELDGSLRSNENAIISISTVGISTELLSEVLMGGYCSHLAFLDPDVVRNGGEIYADGKRSYNDFIAICDLYPNDNNYRVAKGLLTSNLADRAESGKQFLFDRHGFRTYNKLVRNIDLLLRNADAIMQIWEENNFNETLIGPTIPL